MNVRELLRRVVVRVANRLAGEGHHVLHADHRFYLSLESWPSAENRPRWGHDRPPHRQLAALLEERHDAFSDALAVVERYGQDLVQIDRGEPVGGKPTWANEFFTGIDAASLYSFVRTGAPRRYLEIGSGHSTRFAARAKRDGGLGTEIVSIDPNPRSEIDVLCDRVVREPLEEADLDVFGELEAGDILLFDGTHRVYMNSDVTTFFLDALPRVAPGVLIGVHDITLPEDYFAEQAHFYWTEQYMLAMALLAGGPDKLEPVLACHYVCTRPELKQRLDSMWDRIGFAGTNAYGTTFWFRSRIRPGLA